MIKTFVWNDILNFLNTGISDNFFSKGCGISIGSFDGLHIGHRDLLNKMIDSCKSKNLLSGVLTFSRPLPSIKHNIDYSGDISTLNQRLNLFEQLGIDFVILVDFDESFSSMLGTDFLNILINACNMELLAEGIDFRCGYKGACDVQAIKYFCDKNNISTIFVDPVLYNDNEIEERVSSSFIRTMIIKGFFSTVNSLLLRNYSIDLSKQNKDFTTEDNKLKLSLDKILQVIPPKGIYHCQDQNNQDIRIEITQSELIIFSQNKPAFLQF